MSFDPAVEQARTRYPELTSALERHLGWARDFAMAGDVESAADAIRDAHATFGELRASRFIDGPRERAISTRQGAARRIEAPDARDR